jgi:phosphoglycerol transferase MdoB-like AlkP superfamily enzyme
MVGLSILAATALLLPFYLDDNLPGKLPPARVLMNLLPAGLLALAALGLTRRTLLGSVVIGSFLLLLFQVNSIKELNLQEPVVFTDFLLLPQFFHGFEVLGKYVNPIALVVAPLLFLALWLALWKWEKPFLTRAQGLLTFMGSVALILSLSLRDLPLGSLYQSDLIAPQEWNPDRNVKINGLLATLARGSANVLYHFPKPGQNVARKPDFLPETQQLARPERDALPDIIVLLSEGFFDLSILNHSEPCELLPTYCELQKLGQSGRLKSPTFGGNTTRAEFEMLTAIPTEHFQGLPYPYISIVTRPVRSLVWDLKSLGYTTAAIHTHERTFWRRHSALPLLGFDQFRAKEDMTGLENSGFYVADSVLTRELLAHIETASPNHPSFILAISMENHGPWNKQTLARLPDEVKEITVPSLAGTLDDAPLQQYIYHTRNALAELRKIWAIVKKRERNTVVLFFGDHLPALYKPFETLGFDNGRSPYEQPSVFLVLSNFPLVGELPPEMPMHQLLLRTLGAAGVPLNENYRDLLAAYDVDSSGLTAVEQAELKNYVEHLEALLLQTEPGQVP